MLTPDNDRHKQKPASPSFLCLWRSSGLLDAEDSPKYTPVDEAVQVQVQNAENSDQVLAPEDSPKYSPVYTEDTVPDDTVKALDHGRQASQDLNKDEALEQQASQDLNEDDTLEQQASQDLIKVNI